MMHASSHARTWVGSYKEHAHEKNVILHQTFALVVVQNFPCFCSYKIIGHVRLSEPKNTNKILHETSSMYSTGQVFFLDEKERVEQSPAPFLSK